MPLLAVSCSHGFVVDPECHGRCHTNGGDGPPDAGWLVCDLSEVMGQRASKPAADQRSETDGKKRKAHVRALLSFGGEAGNVIVIRWLLRDFSQREHE